MEDPTGASHQLITAPLPQSRAGASDAELLRWFTSTRDEGAFAELVRRHGPMVLGVCRRVLGNGDDAEDAFQAAFFVLALRLRSNRIPLLPANWLFGVARRTAMKARTARLRRHSRERRLWEMLNMNTSVEPDIDELPMVLDAELDRLAAKYRAPVVLCYLEGKTNREAARLLGWPEGTLATRLREAREILRRRLTKKGFALSIDAIGTAFSTHLPPAGVSPTLSASTAKGASLVAGGKAAASGIVSPKALALAKGVSKAMIAMKLHLLVAIVVASPLAVIGVRAVAQSNQKTTVTAVAAAAPVPAPTPPRPAPVVNAGDRARRTALAVLMYIQKHREQFPPDLGATLRYANARDFLSPADEPNTVIPPNPSPEWINQHTSFGYLGTGEMTWKRLRQIGTEDSATILLHQRLKAGDNAPIVVAFMDGHSELLPRRVAEQRIKDSLKKLAPLRPAAQNAPATQAAPDEPSKEIPEVALPAQVRAALEQNAAQLNGQPISISWVERGTSRSSKEQAKEKFYVDDGFFDSHPERAIWQRGKSYGWSKSNNGSTYEQSSDGRILYTRNTHTDAIKGAVSGELTKQSVAELARKKSIQGRLAEAYFSRLGIRVPFWSAELQPGEPESDILWRLAHGARLVAVEDAAMDGRALTRLKLIAHNPDWDSLRTMPKEREYAFYLDPKKHYALCRKEERYGDRLLIQTNNEALERVGASDVWLPRKSTTDYYTWPMIIGTYYDAPILSRVLEVTELYFNKVSDKQFVLNPIVSPTRVTDLTVPGQPVTYDSPAVP